MPNGKDKQPWYSWLTQNRWPWEEPLPQDTTYASFPFLQPRAMAKPGVSPTPRTTAIMQTPQYAAQEQYRRDIPAGLPAHLRPPSPQEAVEAALPTPTPTPPAWIGGYQPPPFPTEPPPAGYEWSFSESAMRWIPKKTKEPAKMSAAERRQMELAERKATKAQEQQMWERMYMERETQQEAEEAARQQAWQREQWQAQQAQQQQQMQWQQQQGQMQMQMEQERIAQQQEEAMMYQQERERQERARLSASPLSWLQYASYTGEQPAIQPWMLPLMQQQYPSLQAGQQIPGWTGESGAGMPELTRPSAQLWSRMGPTSQAQFAGYRQARTGVRPEETMFRMGAQAPPGGRQPLRWTR